MSWIGVKFGRKCDTRIHDLTNLTVGKDSLVTVTSKKKKEDFINGNGMASEFNELSFSVIILAFN